MKIKRKELMKNKGITLIALVITIIVLLILAGVSIALLTGENGILTKASEANRASEIAEIKEQIKLDIMKWKTDNIGKEISNIIIQEIIDPKYGTLDGSNLTTKKGYKIDLSDILSIQQGNLLQIKASPGDYVKYTPEEKTFTMTKEQTGVSTGEQTFNTSTYTGLWQVLYNDEEHGLQIISADSVGELTMIEDLHYDGFGGETDNLKWEVQFETYNNVINNLNRFCSNYVNNKFATSGRCIGSNPNNIFEMEQQSSFSFFTRTGGFDAEIGDENYLIDKIAMEEAKSQNEKGIIDINNKYFLASRYASNTEDLMDGGCGLIGIGKGGNVSFSGMISHVEHTWYTSYVVSSGIRPVIKLKSGIQTSSGDGTEQKPFELIEKQEGELEAGDYVKYDSGANGIILCRVLYDKHSKYGLQIITDECVKEVKLGGDNIDTAKTSYNNAIEILNNETIDYLNKTYAEDVRCVGSNPENKNTEEDDNTIDTNTEYKKSDNNYMSDAIALEVNEMYKTQKQYWMASRKYSGSNIGKILYYNNILKEQNIVSKNKTETLEYGLRPCIKLKDGIKTTSGDGKTEETAYILEI